MNPSEELLHSLPLPIALLGIQGHIAFRNTAWINLFGEPPRQGEAWTQILASPSMEDSLPSSWQNGTCRDRNLDSPALIKVATQQVPRWMLVRVAPLPQPSPEAPAWSLSLVDIQEQREMAEANQTAIQKMEVAEASIASLKRLLAVLAHELRTPVNAIMGWVRLLQLEIENLDRPRVERAINAIERSALAEARLIEDTLDLSRSQNDKLELRLAAVNPITEVTDTIQLLQGLAATKQIKLHFQALHPPAPHWLDPERFRQVLWNLLCNAIKFSPPNSAVAARLDRRQGGLYLEVIDQGIGIAAQHLPHIFEPFWIKTTEPLGRSGGLGLGLAIAKIIVDLHGGSIEAFSEGLGQGSTFRVWLPAQEQSLSVAQDAHPGVARL